MLKIYKFLKLFCLQAAIERHHLVNQSDHSLTLHIDQYLTPEISGFQVRRQMETVDDELVRTALQS
jgi:hypothetical protein